MEKTTKAVAWVVAVLAVPAHAVDIRNQWDIQISKAELVIPGIAPHDAANAIKDAISQFAVPINLSYRAMPAEPPMRPGVPRLTQLDSDVPSPQYVCDEAYAVIHKRPASIKNAYAINAEGHQVCLYSFEKGVKAYVMYYSINKTSALTSGLFDGIRRAIRGSDEERAASQLKGNINDIRAKLPGLLVERIEIPGLPVETPDRDAVAALIPAVEKVAVVQPVAAVGTAAAPAPPAVLVAGSPLQLKVEARKNLQAMGMTYHSQLQFVEAIRRKDDVAVQLFMDGGGISLDAIDSTGKTPLQVAKAQGSADIVALLQPNPQAAVVAAAPPVIPVAVKSAAALPVLLQPANPSEMEVDFSQIPPEQLAQMDEEIARMNLSADDARRARSNLARQYLNVKALINVLKR